MTRKQRNKSKKQIDEHLKIEKNIQKIKHKNVIVSSKEGVGKNTVASNLAFSLFMHGPKIELFDYDITAPVLNINEVIL